MSWWTIIRERRLTRLLERLGEVEEKLLKLEFDVAAVVEKTQRWMWRSVKREEYEGSKQAGRANGPLLDPRSQRANDEILRRRASLALQLPPKLPTED